MLVASESNGDLSKLEGNTQDEEIAADLATAGLKETSSHLLPRCKLWERDRHTWNMLREGMEVPSWTD